MSNNCSLNTSSNPGFQISKQLPAEFDDDVVSLLKHLSQSAPTLLHIVIVKSDTSLLQWSGCSQTKPHEKEKLRQAMVEHPSHFYFDPDNLSKSYLLYKFQSSLDDLGFKPFPGDWHVDSPVKGVMKTIVLRLPNQRILVPNCLNKCWVFRETRSSSAEPPSNDWFFLFIFYAKPISEAAIPSLSPVSCSHPTDPVQAFDQTMDQLSGLRNKWNRIHEMIKERISEVSSAIDIYETEFNRLQLASIQGHRYDRLVLSSFNFREIFDRYFPDISPASQLPGINSLSQTGPDGLGAPTEEHPVRQAKRSRSNIPSPSPPQNEVNPSVDPITPSLFSFDQSLLPFHSPGTNPPSPATFLSPSDSNPPNPLDQEDYQLSSPLPYLYDDFAVDLGAFRLDESVPTTSGLCGDDEYTSASIEAALSDLYLSPGDIPYAESSLAPLTPSAYSQDPIGTVWSKIWNTIDGKPTPICVLGDHKHAFMYFIMSNEHQAFKVIGNRNCKLPSSSPPEGYCYEKLLAAKIGRVLVRVSPSPSAQLLSDLRKKPHWWIVPHQTKQGYATLVDTIAEDRSR